MITESGKSKHFKVHGFIIKKEMMTIINKKILSAFVLLALALLSSCYPRIMYSGKVIDIETLKPIEGVAVAGSWERHSGGFVSTYRVLDVQETLTDKNGEWQINGIKTDWEDSPYFIYFKPG